MLEKPTPHTEMYTNNWYYRFNLESEPKLLPNLHRQIIYLFTKILISNTQADPFSECTQHKNKYMLMLTMRLTTCQWMFPVEGNGELKRAIRMLQKKMRQLDEEIIGDCNHPLDTVEEMTSKAPATATAPMTPATAKKEEVQYYYVMRGPYDKETKTFFSGYVKMAEEYVIKQASTWKFVGNSSLDAEKLTKWILENMDKVNKETLTWFNKEGEFSRKWYTLIHPDGSYWIVATPEEVDTVKASRPKLKKVQPKVHASCKGAVRYVQTNADIFCYTGTTLL